VTPDAAATPDGAGARRPRGRRAAAAGAVLVLLVTLPATACRAFGWEAGPLAVVVALTPWVALLAVLGLLLALLARRGALVALAGAVLALQVVWLAPLLTAAPAPEGPPAFTVATVNLGLGAGSAQTVVDLVRSRHVDVLSVQELTPQAREALQEAGLDDLLAHAVVHPEPGADGIGLWSRRPIAQVPTSGEWFSTPVIGRTPTPVGDLTVVAAHPAAPGVVHHELWAAETRALGDLLAALPGPALLAGDLNTTRDQSPLRRIEAAGWQDAADQAGAGVRMTFPVGRGPLPVVAIDHVLVRDVAAVATAYDVVDVPGSDHRLVVVDYR
jgi:endonuclease/exonuclease/phosphatase (EEP) superfamily protein YafD